MRDKKISKIYRTSHKANAISEASKRDRTNLQSVPKVPKWHGYSSAGGC